MIHRLALVCVACFCFVSACLADIGKVIAISDGDTLTVLAESKEKFRIRVFGIDAPESKQPFGERAKQALSELAFGKQVEFSTAKKDRYGRIVSKVTLPDTRDAGAEMIRVGMACRGREDGSGCQTRTLEGQGTRGSVDLAKNRES